MSDYTRLIFKSNKDREKLIREFAKRKAIVAALKHGMCPDCGSDTRRLYTPSMNGCPSYCSNKNCKYNKKPFIDEYRWLLLHSIN